MISGYPYCRCTQTTPAALDTMPCNICDKDYYYADTKCTECPCMNDKDDVSRCGNTAGMGATSVTACRMSKDYTFADLSGEWNFDSACYASE